MMGKAPLVIIDGIQKLLPSFESRKGDHGRRTRNVYLIKIQFSILPETCQLITQITDKIAINPDSLKTVY